MNVMWSDAAGEEIAEISNFTSIDVVPRVGDKIHYWQDGFPDAAGADSEIRLDFVVTAVEHDLRYMPRGLTQRCIQMVTVTLSPPPTTT